MFVNNYLKQSDTKLSQYRKSRSKSQGLQVIKKTYHTRSASRYQPFSEDENEPVIKKRITNHRTIMTGKSVSNNQQDHNPSPKQQMISPTNSTPQLGNVQISKINSSQLIIDEDKDDIKNQLKKNLKNKLLSRQLADKYKMYEDKKQLTRLIKTEQVTATQSPTRQDNQVDKIIQEFTKLGVIGNVVYNKNQLENTIQEVLNDQEIPRRKKKKKKKSIDTGRNLFDKKNKGVDNRVDFPGWKLKNAPKVDIEDGFVDKLLLLELRLKRRFNKEKQVVGHTYLTELMKEAEREKNRVNAEKTELKRKEQAIIRERQRKEKMEMLMSKYQTPKVEQSIIEQSLLKIESPDQENIMLNKSSFHQQTEFNSISTIERKSEDKLRSIFDVDENDNASVLFLQKNNINKLNRSLLNQDHKKLEFELSIKNGMTFMKAVNLQMDETVLEAFKRLTRRPELLNFSEQAIENERYLIDFSKIEQKRTASIHIDKPNNIIETDQFKKRNKSIEVKLEVEINLHSKQTINERIAQICWNSPELLLEDLKTSKIRVKQFKDIQECETIIEEVIQFIKLEQEGTKEKEASFFLREMKFKHDFKIHICKTLEIISEETNQSHLLYVLESQMNLWEQPLKEFSWYQKLLPKVRCNSRHHAISSSTSPSLWTSRRQSHQNFKGSTIMDVLDKPKYSLTSISTPKSTDGRKSEIEGLKIGTQYQFNWDSLYRKTILRKKSCTFLNEKNIKMPERKLSEHNHFVRRISFQFEREKYFLNQFKEEEPLLEDLKHQFEREKNKTRSAILDGSEDKMKYSRESSSKETILISKNPSYSGEEDPIKMRVMSKLVKTVSKEQLMNQQTIKIENSPVNPIKVSQLSIEEDSDQIDEVEEFEFVLKPDPNRKGYPRLDILSKLAINKFISSITIFAIESDVEFKSKEEYNTIMSKKVKTFNKQVIHQFEEPLANKLAKIRVIVNNESQRSMWKPVKHTPKKILKLTLRIVNDKLYDIVVEFHLVMPYPESLFCANYNIKDIEIKQMLNSIKSNNSIAEREQELIELPQIKFRYIQRQSLFYIESVSFINNKYHNKRELLYENFKSFLFENRLDNYKTYKVSNYYLTNYSKVIKRLDKKLRQYEKLAEIEDHIIWQTLLIQNKKSQMTSDYNWSINIIPQKEIPFLIHQKIDDNYINVINCLHKDKDIYQNRMMQLKQHIVKCEIQSAEKNRYNKGNQGNDSESEITQSQKQFTNIIAQYIRPVDQVINLKGSRIHKYKFIAFLCVNDGLLMDYIEPILKPPVTKKHNDDLIRLSELMYIRKKHSLVDQQDFFRMNHHVKGNYKITITPQNQKLSISLNENSKNNQKSTKQVKNDLYNDDLSCIQKSQISNIEDKNDSFISNSETNEGKVNYIAKNYKKFLDPNQLKLKEYNDQEQEYSQINRYYPSLARNINNSFTKYNKKQQQNYSEAMREKRRENEVEYNKYLTIYLKHKLTKIISKEKAKQQIYNDNNGIVEREWTQDECGGYNYHELIDYLQYISKKMDDLSLRYREYIDYNISGVYNNVDRVQQYFNTRKIQSYGRTMSMCDFDHNSLVTLSSKQTEILKRCVLRAKMFVFQKVEMPKSRIEDIKHSIEEELKLKNDGFLLYNEDKNNKMNISSRNSFHTEENTHELSQEFKPLMVRRTRSCKVIKTGLDSKSDLRAHMKKRGTVQHFKSGLLGLEQRPDLSVLLGLRGLDLVKRMNTKKRTPFGASPTKIGRPMFTASLNVYSEIVFHEIQENNFEGVQEYLRRFGGVSLESHDDNGNTMLNMAAQTGGLEIVEYLLSRGANVNTKNIHGNTPLHYAISYGYMNVAHALICYNPIQSMKNNKNKSPWEGIQAHCYLMM